MNINLHEYLTLYLLQVYIPEASLCELAGRERRL